MPQQKEVLIRRALRFGGNQLVKATVLSQHGSKLRVIRDGERKPVEVEAAEVVDAGATFSGNRLAQQRGVIVSKAYPDNANCISRILDSRSVALKRVAASTTTAVTRRQRSEADAVVLAARPGFEHFVMEREGHGKPWMQKAGPFKKPDVARNKMRKMGGHSEHRRLVSMPKGSF